MYAARVSLPTYSGKLNNGNGSHFREMKRAKKITCEKKRDAYRYR